MKMFLLGDENQFSFVIVQLEFVVSHPSLDVGNTELSRANNAGQRRDIIRFVELVVIRVAMMRKRVVRYNFRDRLRVE